MLRKFTFKQVTRTKNNKKIKLKFKKIAGAKGYEIKYSTSKKFGQKGNKKRLRLKTLQKCLARLKKKTYYIKVRAYKVVEGKTYNSKWSSVKKVGTRKLTFFIENELMLKIGCELEILWLVY